MQHSSLRLPGWQKRLLIWVGLLLLSTGATWLAVNYSVGAGAGPDALPHPAQAGLMRLHGAGVFGALFVSGLLAGGHVAQGWRVASRHRSVRRRQRTSGVLLCVALALVVLSGYALYYLVAEAWRPALGGCHAGLGTLLAIGVLWHGRADRRHRGGGPVR